MKKGMSGKIKPKLTPEMIERLKLREEISRRRPAFRRQEWFRYKRLGTSWRRPRGLHSKMRKGWKYRPKVVKIGFRGPADVRGYHPSGFSEVMVYNVKDLEKIDPKREAARIGGTVGMRKRVEIEKAAAKKKIRVLNPLHREVKTKKEEDVNE